MQGCTGAARFCRHGHSRIIPPGAKADRHPKLSARPELEDHPDVELGNGAAKNERAVDAIFDRGPFVFFITRELGEFALELGHALTRASASRLRDRRVAAGRALPRYVEDEFEAYLTCGLLERGFLQVKCESCQAENLVAFSCKRRGFCPSCGARRMADECRDA
jgi:hypothetical protein